MRALARGQAPAGEATAGVATGRLFDPASEEIAVPETELELNPLGEYLLNCELQSRTFTL